MPSTAGRIDAQGMRAVTHWLIEHSYRVIPWQAVSGCGGDLEAISAHQHMVVRIATELDATRNRSDADIIDLAVRLGAQPYEAVIQRGEPVRIAWRKLK